MKGTQLIFNLSLLLNLVLGGLLIYREVHFRTQQFAWEAEAPNWAKYAGAMQAHADFGNGVRRVYRAMLSSSSNSRAGFTGEHEGIAQVWSWTYHGELGNANRAAAESFTDAYNNRMRDYIANPNLYEPNRLAATQTSE